MNERNISMKGKWLLVRPGKNGTESALVDIDKLPWKNDETIRGIRLEMIWIDESLERKEG